MTSFGKFVDTNYYSFREMCWFWLFFGKFVDSDDFFREICWFWWFLDSDDSIGEFYRFWSFFGKLVDSDDFLLLMIQSGNFIDSDHSFEICWFGGFFRRIVNADDSSRETFRSSGFLLRNLLMFIENHPHCILQSWRSVAVQSKGFPPVFFRFILSIPLAKNINGQWDRDIILFFNFFSFVS